MVTASHTLDRVLVLEMVRVTEAAAVAASKLIGRGDERAADHAAVEAMRDALNRLELGRPREAEREPALVEVAAAHVAGGETKQEKGGSSEARHGSGQGKRREWGAR